MTDGPRSIPFELLRENWNEYTFSDRVVVKTRIILLAVFRESDSGHFTFQTERSTTVSAPEYLRGPPSDFEQGNVGNEGAKCECPILLRYERWNEYVLQDDLIGLRMIFVASKALKTLNAFDRSGQPVYAIDGKPLIKFDDRSSESNYGSGSWTV